MRPFVFQLMVMRRKYGSDSSYAAVGVFIASLLALVTLPLIHVCLTYFAP
ncbi:hypothetical protein [Marinicrinis lubricantis]|uniref:Uncharacterized protein n=1 Tax=Marinicrinis lubricantis TaxID=2086470 RepID=A0ABW1IK65_9BACL